MMLFTREQFIEACKAGRLNDQEHRCILSTSTTEGVNAVLAKDVQSGYKLALQMLKGWSHVHVYTREEDRQNWLRDLPDTR